MGNKTKYIFLFLFFIKFSRERYQMGKVSLESSVFCKYLYFPSTAVNPFKATTKPLYGQNYYPFEDLPLTHVVSPYNLIADARETTTGYYTCLDPSRILMFDKDDNLEVDTEAEYVGYIIENGECNSHEKRNNPTKLYFYDSNYLVFILFTIHNGTDVNDQYWVPTPFKVNTRSFWNVLDPTISTLTEIPQDQALSDPEALFANFLINYNKNDYTRGDFFMERFIAVTGFTENYVSSSNYAKIFEPKFSRLGVNVETKFYAMMTIYYSVKFYERSKNNDDFCRYLTSKAMLWRVKQTSPNALSTKSVHSSVDKEGGFLKYIEDVYKNPIELKASVLSFIAIGYNGYITYEPWKYPMRTRCSLSPNIMGHSMIYCSGQTSHSFWGPYENFPSGNYQVIFTWTAEWKSPTPEDLPKDNIIFDIVKGGSVQDCGTYRDDYDTGWNWKFIVCSFNIPADNTQVQFRAESKTTKVKYFSTLKVRKV